MCRMDLTHLPMCLSRRCAANLNRFALKLKTFQFPYRLLRVIVVFSQFSLNKIYGIECDGNGRTHTLDGAHTILDGKRTEALQVSKLVSPMVSPLSPPSAPHNHSRVSSLHNLNSKISDANQPTQRTCRLFITESHRRRDKRTDSTHTAHTRATASLPRCRWDYSRSPLGCRVF